MPPPNSSSIKSAFAGMDAEYRQQWVGALESSRHQGDVVPVGWATKTQIQKLWNRSNTGTKTHLLELIRAGLVEIRTFKIPDSTGRMMPTPHYFLKNKSNAKRKSRS